MWPGSAGVLGGSSQSDGRVAERADVCPLPVPGWRCGRGGLLPRLPGESVL